ncbi:MAG: sigma-54-dependent Fis family transcriptional regulator [Acidobacteria bacterium]|nr:sigma-54-dependent Fis family transcriptional regulator [Acidobacteriota bacterium]
MPAVIHSRAMREVFERTERAARSDAAVLVEGESGSGKELVARAVHHFSLRCSRPWVDVSCAALPESLIESELFGHEKGAFSGAEAAKPGLFEAAHTGTLFLDEVGELDPRLQVKLLRVLDGAGYYRLGSTRKIFVDVRIVAASNRDLLAGIESGQFRGDLYHRLGQICIRVPALRERPEDVLPLALFYLRRGNPEMRLSADAVRALTEYHWPGNVRQLRNVILKTIVFSTHPLVELADLPAEVTGRTCRVEPPPAAAGSRIDCVERKLIMNTLASTGGHQQRAARMLGISRRTLARKLKVYRLESSSKACAT